MQKCLSAARCCQGSREANWLGGRSERLYGQNPLLWLWTTCGYGLCCRSFAGTFCLHLHGPSKKKNIMCIMNRFLPLPDTFVLLSQNTPNICYVFWAWVTPLHTPTDRIIVIFISPFEAVAYPAYSKAVHNTGRPQRTRKLVNVIISLNYVKVLFSWKHRWLQPHAISAFLPAA